MSHVRSRLAALAAVSTCAVYVVLPASAGASRSATAPQASAVPADFVGMNVNAPLFPGYGVNLSAQLGTMVSSGVETIRVLFD
jgi:hypothetical protein